MSAKKTITGAGVVAAGALAAVIGLSGGEDKPVTRELPAQAKSVKMFERDVCTKAVRTPGGKLVRVVGVQADSQDAVADTELGRTVVVSGVSERSLCHVMIDAKPKKKTEDDGVGCSRDYADIPELFPHFGKASCPVKIGGSEVSGSYLWSVLLRGDACMIAGDLPSYKGSDMHDFLKLPMEQKRRFLKVQGQCPVDGGFVGCTVPVGDPRAVPGSPVQVPHGWAGRRDLNYVRAVGGKPELRYDIPDGGFEVETP